MERASICRLVCNVGLDLSGSTLQELKLQRMKIRNNVVSSRYSRAKCFANDLGIFLASAQWPT